MHSPDDKQFPLAQIKRAQRQRRAITKKDFSLPKPYRRHVFCDEPSRLTRLQVSLLGFAGLMVATLLGVLALLAHESEHSLDGKPIVAAAAEARRTSYSAPPAESTLAPAGRHAPRTAPAVKAKPALRAKPAPRLAAIPRKAPALPARRPDTVPVPAPDPDVTLIAAILQLTPAPAPAPVPAVSMELAGCTRVATPSCSK